MKITDLSTQPQTTIVPDVYEEDPATAAKDIQDTGLVPVFNGSGTWVSSQSPFAGEVVVVGSTVTIPRLHLIPLPTCSSWMNPIERIFFKSPG